MKKNFLNFFKFKNCVLTLKQLTSELGVWGRDPHLAKARIAKFPDADYYAPWCPACKQFTKTWKGLADYSSELGTTVFF